MFSAQRLQRSLFLLAACCVTASMMTVDCLADDSAKFASIVDQTFVADYDGTQQKYVVLTPPGMSEKAPVSILITLHGHGSDRWQFVQQTRGECQAARDVALEHHMLMVSPDYRAKTSWMGPAAEADMVQLIRILRDTYNVELIIVSGGSMGGTGALTFAAMHSELVDGVVSLNGTANLVEYERFQDAIATSFGGSKEQVPQEYRKRSAEFFPMKFTMPLACTTGGTDDIVPPDSVLRLVDQVRIHNPNVLSIHQPEGGHSTTYADSKQAFEYVIRVTNPAAR
ncbi:MAG: alpha/beta fold hydrolase [Planctomycetaceae bacterium]|nr:alpha/beta fold hydrolase [Planctomycetaceae bacterium]